MVEAELTIAERLELAEMERDGLEGLWDNHCRENVALKSENAAMRALLVRAGRVLGPFADWYGIEKEPDEKIELQWSFGDRGHFEVLSRDFRAARDLKAEIEEIVKS